SVFRLFSVCTGQLFILALDKTKKAFGWAPRSVLCPRPRVDFCAIQGEMKFSTADTSGAELPGHFAVLFHGLDQKDHLRLTLVGENEDCSVDDALIRVVVSVYWLRFELQLVTRLLVERRINNLVGLETAGQLLDLSEAHGGLVRRTWAVGKRLESYANRLW